MPRCRLRRDDPAASRHSIASDHTPTMQLQNRHRRAVDPVPFVVVAVLAGTATFSLGPGYLLTLGLSLRAALVACAGATVLTTVVAYHRFVWTVRPELRREVPVELRLRRLLYGGVALVALVPLFALPLAL